MSLSPLAGLVSRYRPLSHCSPLWRSLQRTKFTASHIVAGIADGKADNGEPLLVQDASGSAASATSERRGRGRAWEDVEPYEREAAKVLQKIVTAELVGVLRYTTFSMLVSGPHRLTLGPFFKQQATESLLHAQEAGNLITGLDGEFRVEIPDVVHSGALSVYELLKASYAQESEAIALYKELLKQTEGKSVYLEEYARNQVAQEEQHRLELRKLLRDFRDGASAAANEEPADEEDAVEDERRDKKKKKKKDKSKKKGDSDDEDDS